MLVNDEKNKKTKFTMGHDMTEVIKLCNEFWFMSNCVILLTIFMFDTK